MGWFVLVLTTWNGVVRSRWRGPSGPIRGYELVRDMTGRMYPHMKNIYMCHINTNSQCVWIYYIISFYIYIYIYIYIILYYMIWYYIILYYIILYYIILYIWIYVVVHVYTQYIDTESPYAVYGYLVRYCIYQVVIIQLGYMGTRQWFCWFLFLSIYLPTYLPACLPTYLPISLYMYISICIYIHTHVYTHPCGYFWKLGCPKTQCFDHSTHGLSNVQEKGSHLSQQKWDRTNHAGDTGIYIWYIQPQRWSALSRTGDTPVLDYQPWNLAGPAVL